MNKSVNGVIVPMTAEEIAARQAEEAAWTPSPARRLVPVETLIVDALVAEGVLTAEVAERVAERISP
jgi:hypothetical protein